MYKWAAPMLLVFVIVSILGCFFAYISQKKDYSVRLFPIYFSLLTLWFPVAFTDSGIDYYNYIGIIRGLEWSNYLNFSASEAGFNYISLIVRDFFGGNEHACLFVYKTLTLILFYFSIFLLRKQMKIWICVAAYLLLFYIPSFYLISICLTASITFYAFALYYSSCSKKKAIIACGLIFASGFLHNSAFVYLPIFILCLAFDGTFGYLLHPKNKCLVVIIAVILALSSSLIFQLSASNFEGFHYNSYASNSFEGSGFMVIVRYGTLLFIYLLLLKLTSNKRMINWIFIYSVFSCLFFVLSYQFRVIERMEFYTMVEYILFFPIVFNNLQHNSSSVGLKFFYTLFLLWMGYNVIDGRISSTVDMNIYRFFNPFLQ